jgi:hypothetical protein
LTVRVDFPPWPLPAGQDRVLQWSWLYGHRPWYNTDGFQLLNVGPHDSRITDIDLI